MAVRLLHPAYLHVFWKKVIAIGAVIEVNAIEDLILNGNHLRLVVAIVPMLGVDLLFLFQLGQSSLLLAYREGRQGGSEGRLKNN